MATVLLTWELGRGYGHLGNLYAFAKELSLRQHTVVCAFTDLVRTAERFHHLGVAFLQAPTREQPVAQAFDPAPTFAHLLYNIGFGDTAYLKTVCEAWQHLYHYVDPDLVIFDHSPTALLAIHGLDCRRALVGTGFFCPPLQYPLRTMFKTDVAQSELKQVEDFVVSQMNAVSGCWQAPPLESVSQLFTQVDENFLVTFEELDHYPNRGDGSYCGDWPAPQGITPRWPPGNGPKIYAYLKPSEHVYFLLSWLAQQNYPTIVFSDGLNPGVKQELQGSSVLVEDSPLNLTEIGTSCDFAILNANHSTTASILLHGKPCVLLPLHLEQAVFADSVERLGAGLKARVRNKEEIIGVIERLMSNLEQYRAAANTFASKYDLDEGPSSRLRMVDRACELLPAP